MIQVADAWFKIPVSKCKLYVSRKSRERNERQKGGFQDARKNEAYPFYEIADLEMKGKVSGSNAGYLLRDNAE